MNKNEELVIETHNLCKSFGEVHALQNLNLRVPRQSIYGFLGPNGAGKTTLMKILLGLIRPTAGSGAIFNQDIERESVSIRERIGYLPQQPRFIEYMTARENLLFSARFFFSGPRAKIQARCDEVLELVGLEDTADRPIKGFSGGEKQRLGIALAQLNYPELLILDEPAAALDPLGRQAVLEVMAQLREHTTIFYSTHILDDVQRVSDTVAILNRGKLMTSGPIHQILTSKDGVSYTIGIKGSPDGLGERLKSLPWITNITVNKYNDTSIWHVGVNDEGVAEKKLLRWIMKDQEVVVTEFSRVKYELEEVFMEIVRGDRNDRKN